MTNYKKTGDAMKIHLITLYASGGTANEVRDYWEAMMGELEESDPKFSESKLKGYVFGDQSN